jgi:hypothetical protein
MQQDANIKNNKILYVILFLIYVGIETLMKVIVSDKF